MLGCLHCLPPSGIAYGENSSDARNQVVHREPARRCVGASDETHASDASSICPDSLSACLKTARDAECWKTSSTLFEAAIPVQSEKKAFTKPTRGAAACVSKLSRQLQNLHQLYFSLGFGALRRAMYMVTRPRPCHKPCPRITSPASNSY